MLSRDWSVDRFFTEAYRDVAGGDYSVNDPVYNERFRLVNRAISGVVGTFADLLAREYLIEQVCVVDNTGLYLTGAASYAAASATLTAVMNGNFQTTDIGKLVVMRSGTSFYLGQIASFVSTTSVTLSGLALPSTDIGSLDDVLAINTSPAAGQINISGLRPMRAANQLNVSLKSTATSQVKALSPEQFDFWQPTDLSNANTLVWSLVGDTINLNWGSNLSGPGTVTIRLPQMPQNVSYGSQLVDVVDGAPVEIALIKLKMILIDRLKKPPVDFSKELQFWISSLYSTYKGNVETEIVQNKIAALK